MSEKYGRLKCASRKQWTIMPFKDVHEWGNPSRDLRRKCYLLMKVGEGNGNEVEVLDDDVGRVPNVSRSVCGAGDLFER